MNVNPVTRRWFFEQCGVGLGAIALKTLLAESAQASTDPMAPKPPQFPAKAKNVIFLFMAGAPSHGLSSSTTNPPSKNSTERCPRLNS